MSDYSFRFFVIGVLQNLPNTLECSAFHDGGLPADLGHDATFTLQWDAEDDVLYRIWWLEADSLLSVCEVDHGGEEMGAVSSWKGQNLEDALSKLNGVMRNLTSGGESQEEMDHG